MTDRNLLNSHQNHAARIFNSTIRTYTTPIQALNSIDNVPIATFPRTISEVQALNGECIPSKSL